MTLLTNIHSLQFNAIPRFLKTLVLFQKYFENFLLHYFLNQTFKQGSLEGRCDQIVREHVSIPMRLNISLVTDEFTHSPTFQKF